MTDNKRDNKNTEHFREYGSDGNKVMFFVTSHLYIVRGATHAASRDDSESVNRAYQCVTWYDVPQRHSR